MNRIGANSLELPKAIHATRCIAVFHILRRSVAFADLGADHLDRVDKYRTAKRLVRRLDALGYEVMVRPKMTTA